MATKNNRRTKITKMLLKESLMELLAQKGIGQISIKELCENADLHRSTFYLHYADQYDLLADIEREIIEDADAHLKGITSDIGSLSYLTTLLQYIAQNQNTFYILFCKYSNLSFYDEFLNKSMEHVKKSISFTCPPQLENYAYTFVMQGCAHIIKDWLMADCDVSCETIAELIFRLAHNALADLS